MAEKRDDFEIEDAPTEMIPREEQRARKLKEAEEEEEEETG